MPFHLFGCSANVSVQFFSFLLDVLSWCGHIVKSINAFPYFVDSPVLLHRQYIFATFRWVYQLECPVFECNYIPILWTRQYFFTSIIYFLSSAGLINMSVLFLNVKKFIHLFASKETCRIEVDIQSSMICMNI